MSNKEVNEATSEAIDEAVANEAENDETVNEQTQTANEEETSTQEAVNEEDSSEAGKDKKDAIIDELKDKLVRNMAEFENFRKRSEKEKTAMYEIGAKSVIEKLLPVIDNFERGFDAVSEEEAESAFVKGTKMIYTQLMENLDQIGVKAIEAVGTEFNTDYHNAIMHVDDDSLGENVVVEEFQKGYMYKDTVIRHSMVKVAN